MKNLIRGRRQELGFSQVRLAALTGMANGSISDFELGKRQPWPKARKSLARALGTTESELFPTDETLKERG